MHSQLLANALKILLTAMATIFATESIAAQLNLSGGESAIIQPNTATTVTCGGGGSDYRTCSDIVSGFRAQLEACASSHGGSYCADRYWPIFKSANPHCAYAGAGACIDYCRKSHDGGYCADRCR